MRWIIAIKEIDHWQIANRYDAISVFVPPLHCIFFPHLRLLIVFNLRASNGRSHYYLECIILQLKEINGQKNQLFRLGWRNSMKKTKLASQLISVAQINCRVAKNENNWRIRRKMVHMTLGKSKMGERQCMNRDRETELRFTTLELKYIYTLSNFKHEQETHNR